MVPAIKKRTVVRFLFQPAKSVKSDTGKPATGSIRLRVAAASHGQGKAFGRPDGERRAAAGKPQVAVQAPWQDDRHESSAPRQRYCQREGLPPS